MDYQKKFMSLMISILFILLVAFTGCEEDEEYVPGETWTFMVYMSDCDLESFGISDINEMESVGSGGNVNIIVQFDRWYSNSQVDDVSNGDWTTAKRFYISQDSDRDRISSIELLTNQPST